MSKQILGLRKQAANRLTKAVWFSIICFLCLCQATQAQTTAFTYQGKLSDGGVAANGQYDFTFRLFDASSGGMQVGSDVVRGDVQVTGGVFTVNLDFGSSPFTSATGNFLEISVRPGASTGTFTPLVPLQPITSSPYATKTSNATSADSLSAACVSCVTDANIDSVGANKITGVLSYFQGGTGIGGTFLPAGVFLRSNGAGWEANGLLASDIPSGSANYIQNTTTAQTTSNFNISGNGTANIFNATTQYNLGGNRVLSNAGISNLFAGTFAGQANTSGDANSFFGSESGSFNTTGRANSFVGFIAGRLNTLGNNNTFLGSAAGDTNTTGSRNTIIGSLADVSTNNLNYATAIGADAVVSSSNTVVLGRSLDTVRIPGALNVTGATTFGGTLGANIINATTQYNIGGNRVLSVAGTNNLFVGVNAGQANTMGMANSFFGPFAGFFNSTGNGNAFFGFNAGDTNTVGGDVTLVGSNADVTFNNLTNATAIGANSVVSQSNSLVLGSAANVGIGTSAPNSKLQVAGGNIYITNPGSLITTSPNGACWAIAVSNAGVLSATSVACP